MADKSKMNPNIKNIGVLTSGGDAPGMNAIVRAVVRAGLSFGYGMYGVRRGFHGLWRGDIERLETKDVSGILQRGGTFLMTARSDSFRTLEGQKKAKNMMDVFGIDALVVIGGDGTFQGAQALTRLGVPVICIPGTIDNDIDCTEYTVGFDTALNTAMEAIDKIKDTASSHERCSVVEVMGRNAGYLALEAGISTGAEVILIPEVEWDFNQDVVRRLLYCRNAGKNHYVVLVAEGAGNAEEIAQKIQDETGIESRATVLGHMQRGGSPTVRDRYTASLMGATAIDCINEDNMNRIIGVKGGQIVDIDIEEGLASKKVLNKKIYDIAGYIAI
ncbi:6-phosphofructokinase [Fastidiosipila sanguinis]|uniref:ATP-dependent 6-phosphofructokinase n=1 Tax=Fastidiosipila sanguinis TaxID=236753 RepID=A0A2S0KLZ3_9FIRM|nr:6-phosphofructokinase [Fastidiosipila sanguinis]AVM42060.1 6-phosphofructokinase [Fastidiosipila sanguinis]